MVEDENMTPLYGQVDALAPVSSPEQGFPFSKICISDYVGRYLGGTKLNELPVIG